jgi:hypothetical protein
MKLFTFSFASQYVDAFYQVIAKDEDRARVLLAWSWGKDTSSQLISEFEIPEQDERIVFSREIDNPTYEG